MVLARMNGSHHILVNPNNLKTISVPIHGGQEIRTGTARNILKAAHISEGEK